MRYLELSLQQPPVERHPMHQFIVDHDAYEASRLLYQHRYATDEHAMLFHVDGPQSPYDEALEEVASVREFEFAPCRDDSFYLYIRESVSETGQAFVDAVSQPGLVAIPPQEFRADGTVRVAGIGPEDAIQAVVDEVSTMMDVTVLSVGDYRAGRIDTRADLTRRQFDAVSAAVDCGYYHVTRDASLEDVADRLGCSSGTAGELLRRAERTVMERLVEDGSF